MNASWYKMSRKRGYDVSMKRANISKFSKKKYQKLNNAGQTFIGIIMVISIFLFHRGSIKRSMSFIIICTYFICVSKYVLSLHQRPVLDPFIGYDDDSMDSETSSMASFRTDRTPATPDDDLDEVSLSLVFDDDVTKSSF